MEPNALEPLPTTQREHFTNCNFCGHQNLQSAKFCSKCGAKISLAAVTRAYVEPIAHRFGLLLLLAIPIALVCLMAFSFIAGGLGFGNAVRPAVNALILGIGGLALVSLVLGILILTYKKLKIK